jgi:hypothetical protein
MILFQKMIALNEREYDFVFLTYSKDKEYRLQLFIEQAVSMSKEQQKSLPYFVAMVDEEERVIDTGTLHDLGFDFKIGMPCQLATLTAILSESGDPAAK